jgi:hypothetical protein
MVPRCQEVLDAVLLSCNDRQWVRVEEIVWVGFKVENWDARTE